MEYVHLAYITARQRCRELASSAQPNAPIVPDRRAEPASETHAIWRWWNRLVHRRTGRAQPAGQPRPA